MIRPPLSPPSSVSTRSAGGQLEQPWAVKSSTTTGCTDAGDSSPALAGAVASAPATRTTAAAAHAALMGPVWNPKRSRSITTCRRDDMAIILTGVKRAPAGILPVITIDRASPKPLYRQLYDGYREAILERRLSGGQRLPSTRSLAAELGISRIPVLNAFEQLLAEGYFESRVGAGTFVAASLPDSLSRPV